VSGKSTYAFALLAIAAVLAIAGCGSSSSSSSGGGGVYGGGNKSGGGEETSTGSETSSSNSGGGYAAPSASEEPSSAEPSTAAAVVAVGNAANVGQVLVDSKGMTLYYFEKDKKGSGVSKCSGACASAWPPLTTGGAAKPMSGVQSSMLGTIKRSDGTTQVTYAGWPLYTFVEDKKPGEDNGTDSKAFGASWYPLHPNGEKAGH
jgi:predicted lipoprotein with Yx(FWY)xxD motif